jgi:hypothetical protein
MATRAGRSGHASQSKSVVEVCVVASIACGVWCCSRPVNRARVATRSIVEARQPITTLFDQRCSKQCQQAAA